MGWLQWKEVEPRIRPQTIAGQLADVTLREILRVNNHGPWRGLGTKCRDQRRPRQKTRLCEPVTLEQLLPTRETPGTCEPLSWKFKPSFHLEGR